MPQLQLPIFPDGVTHITEQLAFMKENGQVTYFNGHMPVFTHAETDIATFRMITSQFCASGHVKHPHLWGDIDQREEIREDVPGEGAERILRPARHAWRGGVG